MPKAREDRQDKRMPMVAFDTHRFVKRLVRVEEELKHQRELIGQILTQVDKRFDDMNRRFEEMSAQMDKRFDGLDRRLDRYLIWSLGVFVALLAAMRRLPPHP
ncbi:MAG: hypothetical protein D6771_06925 [Zetaproteobacteria bacterium]|nr:MAG: hypothetical protein D6771_06925 [Zetaproteobacteria bacterium]